MTATQHHSSVTVTLDGEPLGIFETRTGGDPTASVSKYRPGGMKAQKTRNGLPDYSDVVVSRSRELGVEEAAIVKARRRTGLGIVVVTDQPLDANGSPFGKPDVYTGTLAAMKGGDSDANSDDGKMFELTITVTEVA